MPRKHGAFAKPADQSGMATTLYGDAIAVGTETLTSVDATSNLVDNGKKATAKGCITSTAAAQSSDGTSAVADAETSVAVVGADRIRVTTIEKSFQKDGVAYETSVTKYKAVDFAHKDSKHQVVVHKDIDIIDGKKIVTVTKDISIERHGCTFETSITKTKVRDLPRCNDDDHSDFEVDLDGNVATLNVDANALGENTLVAVDAYALALEDQLSQSTLLITSAVD